jgi:hypothetical protein
MSLPTPKLDDRNWDDLVDEAKRRIAVKCPDWTDFNPSDPGMTLVELMAWMTETVLYRLNRVPEKNYIKFLELIGVRLLPAKPARAWVFFQVQTDANEEALAPVLIGTRISTRPQREREPVTFATLHDLHLTSREIIKTCSRYSPSAVRDTRAVIDELEEVHNLCGNNPWEAEIFHRPRTDPQRGKAVAHNLYLGDQALGDPVLAKAWQQAALQVLVEIEKPMNGQVFLEWEAWDGETWQIVVPREDTTVGFRSNGSVLFDSLPAMKKRSLADLTRGQFGGPASTPGKEDDPLLLRARLIGSEVEELPTLRSVRRRLDLTGCVVPCLKAFVETPPPDRPPYASPVPPQPIETSIDFYPFGVGAVRGSVFYIASELFQKRGAIIAIQFALRKSLQPQSADVLEIHWEYKSRGGDWQTLGKSTPGESPTPDQRFQDHTRAFTRDGQVRFLCPEDIEQTEVGGQLGWFVRARVERADLEPEAARLVARSVLLGFTNEVRPWAHCLSENYSNFEAHPPGTPFSPFIIKAPQDPAFYLCFKGRPSVARGPYRLFLDVVRQQVVPLAPKMKWEYSAAGGWNPLKADDGTEGFAHEGTLDFLSPGDWNEAIEFEQPGYWLRVRWGIAELIMPPRLRRVLLNGVEVEQAAKEERVLGSSDGLADQIFSLHASILEDPEIWVRESDTTSEETVAALKKEADGTVEKGEEGVWVQWQEVRNFHRSKLRDQNTRVRHFFADLDSGTFVFGDGTYGSIPPKGRANIKARYRVTQGSRGNVGSDTITVLEARLPQIQGARNVHPAEGGCDRETIEKAKQRAPFEVKHGNRAVTAEDFTALARKASPLVGKAECYEEDGIIRVIIVPNDEVQKPQPSQRLIQDVFSYLDDKRLINTRLEVHGPLYEAIDVEIEVVLETLFRARFDAVRQLIEQRLHTFVHPLFGMADGLGWPMGRTLHLSELYYRLEGLDGVDHVGKLRMRKSGTEYWEDAIRIGDRSFPCFSKEMKIEQSFV